MATTTSSPFLAPLRFSTQIAGSPTTSAAGSAPVLRICCWKRFVASRCEVYLVPARFPRPLPRRRNALRDKASPLLPLPVVPHQVRHPYDESSNLESLDSQEPKPGCLDAEPSSDFKEKLEISGGLGASRSGNVDSESELDGENDAIGVTEEEITFCGAGVGPVFSVYEGPEENVVSVEVGEDEIINRSEAAVGLGGVDSECMLSHATVMAMELKCGDHVAPKTSSLFQFVAADRVESPVLNGVVTVAQRNATPLRSVAWSGLAALCGVCVVFFVSKLIQTNSKVHLLRRLPYIHRPGMEWDEFDKGKMTMLNNAHVFSGGLLKRPHLDRKELMNNIKRAKESRGWFIIRNSFSFKTAANGDDTSIAEIRRTVTEVQTPGVLEQTNIKENNGVFFPHLVASEEEVSSRINRTSCELASEEEFTEICAKNLDSIHGTKSSVPCISDQQIICTKDNANESSINVLSETAGGFSSDCFDISSSELRNNKTPMDISVSDVNAIQEVGVLRISAKDSQTAHCEELAHNMSIIEPVNLKRDNMGLVQESKPSISTRNDKQTSHVNEKEDKERAILKEAQARLEKEDIGILDSGCTSSLYAQEETVQHKFSKCSTSEKKQEKSKCSTSEKKQEKITSSNKKASAHVSKNKGKLQKEVCSNKEAETKQSEQGVPGTKIVNDPSNCVQKTKRLTKKRLKKVQNYMQRVATEDDVQSSMDDQKTAAGILKSQEGQM
ncbi:hypothetical protein BAE44_0024298 [Dichanthelium oligosanthes]|uniref:Uncharacterized protein n=1 Tax=Dichanthelium oligosanthes TaxID=888268 RepID=A0A1E5UP74_9POAL|nr:hypothetical protein BAE44_0024298 [Dichanthelium oligosanthes]